ncbi:hypothetical protein [Clostridium sp.]|uniref:hypothetical protein n=1 Tax=Clostridium sp. TaxID=1506 RepID=UPI001A5ACA16|nr:hypothetical protein [Clostridium sp.]MBK5243131.1 hypothetical protein [Clostridium sp.]
MTTEAKIQLTSTEVGILWMIYTSQSARITIINLLRDKTIDKGCFCLSRQKGILVDYIEKRHCCLLKLMNNI